MDEQEESDITKLKYVLYARKSTDVFKQMLADIKKGVYDAILAWNPYPYQLKPPFDEMLKMRQQRTGRVTANYIELLNPLVESIITHWDNKIFEKKMLEHERLKNQPQMGYNCQYEY